MTRYQAHLQPHAHREEVFAPRWHDHLRLAAETAAFLFVVAVVIAVLGLEAVG